MNPYQEFLSCQQDFSYFAEHFLKIVHPIRGIIPFELYPFQKNLLDIYDKNRFVLAIKFRQGGFTTITVLHGLWKCMFKSGLTYYFASKTEREAIHIGKIVDMALERFPAWFSPRLDKNTQTEKIFSTTGSRMLFGSVDGVRGKDISHLVLDEPAFIPNMDEKWRTCWPLLTKASVYGVSTTNGIGNWFEETWHGAQEGRNKFVAYHGNYKDHPDYADEAWVEEMRKQLGEKAFQQEVLGNFVADEPEFATIDFSGVDNKALLSMGVKLIGLSKASFEDKAVIYEMMKRLAGR